MLGSEAGERDPGRGDLDVPGVRAAVQAADLAGLERVDQALGGAGAGVCGLIAAGCCGSGGGRNGDRCQRGGDAGERKGGFDVKASTGAAADSSTVKEPNGMTVSTSAVTVTVTVVASLLTRTARPGNRFGATCCR